MRSRSQTAFTGFLVLLALFGVGALLVREPFAPRLTVHAATNRDATVAVFRGDTLDDLARLLKPLEFKAGGVVFYLRDAVYTGAVDGRARLLTLWLTEASTDDSFILSHLDSSKTPDQVADALVTGNLRGRSFLVMPVQLQWNDWKLSLARGTGHTLRGPAATSQLIAAISGSPVSLAESDTRSVSIPIGYSKTKSTAWAVWFDADQVVIAMTPVPIGSPVRPDTSALGGKAGLLVGDGFLNDVFANQYRDNVWDRDVNGTTYRIHNVRYAAQDQMMVVSADLLDVPNPAAVGLQATFGGDDLKPVKVGGTVDCRTLPAAPCLSLQTRVNLATIALTVNATSNPQLVRPEGVQPLGNFFIGPKALRGVARIDRMNAAAGAIVLEAVFRFQAGHLR